MITWIDDQNRSTTLPCASASNPFSAPTPDTIKTASFRLSSINPVCAVVPSTSWRFFNARRPSTIEITGRPFAPGFLTPCATTMSNRDGPLAGKSVATRSLASSSKEPCLQKTRLCTVMAAPPGRMSSGTFLSSSISLSEHGVSAEKAPLGADVRVHAHVSAADKATELRAKVSERPRRLARMVSIPLIARPSRSGGSCVAIASRHKATLRRSADTRARRYPPARSGHTRARPSSCSGNNRRHWRSCPSR